MFGPQLLCIAFTFSINKFILYYYYIIGDAIIQQVKNFKQNWINC